MKKHLLFLLFCFIFFQTAFCQYDQKYLNYRERFRKYFTVVGSGQGESNVLVIRNGKEKGDKTAGATEIRIGNQVMNLGDYIAMLAMEYKILSQAGQSVNQTAKELYYALYAFNRLDYVAETHFNKSPELNGFFIRDDVYSGTDFIANHPQLNNGLSAPVPPKLYVDYDDGLGDVQWVEHTPTNPNYTWNSIFQFPGPDDCGIIDDDGYDKQKDFRKRDLPSPDEIVGLFFGMAMVVKCVPPGANYGMAFQDGNVNFVDAARGITDRVITWMRDNGWDIKSPTGCTLFSGPEWLKYGYAIAAGEIWGEHDKYRESMSGIGWCSAEIWADVFDGSGQDVNTKITSMLAAIGNSWNCLGGTFDTYNRIVDVTSNYNNWKYFYPLIYTVLHGGTNSISLSEVEILLASAPDNGPFNHNTTNNPNDFASSGWCTEFLFRMNNDEQQCVDGDGKATRDPGNYPGLDYMLLYNLHWIITHPPPQQPNCTVFSADQFNPGGLFDDFDFSDFSDNLGFVGSNVEVKNTTVDNGHDLHVTDKIHTSGTVKINSSDKVWWTAGNIIELNPGFKTEDGTNFTAEIIDCIEFLGRTANPDNSGSGSGSSGNNRQTAANSGKQVNNAGSNQSAKGESSQSGQSKNVSELRTPNSQLISIIPNPSASGIFTVAGVSSSGSITVMNVLGEKIYEKRIGTNQLSTTIDISTQPQGIYFVKVQSGEQMSVHKIIYQ